jgi:hypothetical protein
VQSRLIFLMTCSLVCCTPNCTRVQPYLRSL